MSEERAGVFGLDALVFLDELVLLAVLAVAGARLGRGLLVSVVLAVAFVAVTVLVWGRWLAPTSSRRLAHPVRLPTKLALVLVAAGLLGASRAWLWALAFLVVSALVMTLGERAESGRG